MLIRVNVLKETLPRRFEPGYVFKDISINDSVGHVDILIDEDIERTIEVERLKTWPRNEQAITLVDLTV